MVGLNAILLSASEALNANTGALAITNNNVANVNTPGYSREVVHLSANGSNSQAQDSQGGVSLDGYTSVRDAVLQLGINANTSDAAALAAQSGLWSQLQTAFSSTTGGVGGALSSFYSSFSALSTAPNDGATRQAALSSANSLVSAFHQAAAALSDAQSKADKVVEATVSQVNQLTSQIASLNGQLAKLQGTNQDGGSLEDQRDALTTQLSGLLSVQSVQTQTSPSLGTANGSPLVVGNTSYALTVVEGTDAKTHVLDAEGKDITTAIEGGTLGGNVSMRDQQIPTISSDLDTLAQKFASAVNGVQSQGYDQSGAPGAAMFSVPTASAGSASSIGVALTSSSQIAVSSDASSGSSGNVPGFLALQTQPLVSGASSTDAYADIVQRIGTAGSEANSSLTTTNAALTQMTNQLGSESGVSLDEETTNLLRFQQAYVAAAKVITTVNNLYQVLFSMDGAA